ncbi:MAG: hypothetical protein RIS35_2878 [Pseudomonadota bacterium]
MDAPGPRRPDLVRWFIALRPSPASRRALHAQGRRLARRFGGRVVPENRIHLTLAFIGMAPGDLAPVLCETLAGLPPPGGLTVDRIGSFDGRLLWIAPSSPPGWLGLLSDTVREALARLEVPFDRKAFRPHVTLVRDARPTSPELLRGAADPTGPIELATTTLHPVESFTDRLGLHYRFLPLSSPKEAPGRPKLPSPPWGAGWAQPGPGGAPNSGEGRPGAGGGRQA